MNKTFYNLSSRFCKFLKRKSLYCFQKKIFPNFTIVVSTNKPSKEKSFYVNFRSSFNLIDWWETFEQHNNKRLFDNYCHIFFMLVLYIFFKLVLEFFNWCYLLIGVKGLCLIGRNKLVKVLLALKNWSKKWLVFWLNVNLSKSSKSSKS